MTSLMGVIAKVKSGIPRPFTKQLFYFFSVNLPFYFQNQPPGDSGEPKEHHLGEVLQGRSK